MVQLVMKNVGGFNIPQLDFGEAGNQKLKKFNTGVMPTVGMVLPTGGISTAWNALGTTGKVAIGAGAGYLASSFFGGSKKQEQTESFAPQSLSQPIVVQPVVVQPNNPVNNQYDYSQMFNTIANSPYSSISAKKGGMSLNAPFEPAQNVPFQIVPIQTASQKGEQGQGTDWATLAAIAGVALVAYGYTSRRGK